VKAERGGDEGSRRNGYSIPIAQTTTLSSSVLPVGSNYSQGSWMLCHEEGGRREERKGKGEEKMGGAVWSMSTSTSWTSGPSACHKTLAPEHGKLNTEATAPQAPTHLRHGSIALNNEKCTWMLDRVGVRQKVGS